MRLEIARAAKEQAGPVAVVCGAWHVPALARAQHATSADRELLKGRPKSEDQGDLGAVDRAAPVACQRLWRGRRRARLVRACLGRAAVPADGAAVWLTRIAAADARQGAFRLDRLGDRGAAARHRAGGDSRTPGARASRNCATRRSPASASASALLWDQIAADLLIGSGVGAIPEDTPLAPLLEDLQRQQRLTRLKPEALERELAVDLRSDSGLARSTLLHRLTALDVPWGRLADAGRSRGTFREKWLLCWEPEFAVRLVENLGLRRDHCRCCGRAASSPRSRQRPICRRSPGWCARRWSRTCPKRSIAALPRWSSRPH